MRWLREENGTSLVELIAGLAVAFMVLSLLASLELTAWKAKIADEDRFDKETMSVLALDHFVTDARGASLPLTLTSGDSTITLNVAGSAVTYSFDAASGAVTRTAGGLPKVVGHNLSAVRYYLDADGRTVRAELTATRRDGSQYQVTAKATLRN